MKCWLCDVEFPIKRELKSHLAGPIHDRMRVVCPWCYQEEKCFKKISDLKKHAYRQHRVDVRGLPQEYFGEPNGFYLALYPRDYMWIVGPTDYNSHVAKTARWSISNWLNRCKHQSKSRNQWIDGWLAGRNDASQENPQKTTTVEQPEPYLPTMPAVGEENIQLESIQLGNGSSRAYLFSQGNGFTTWYEVKLADRVLQERKHVESLTRKMMVTSDTGLIRPCTGGMALKDELIKEKLCQKLGVPTEFVTDVYRRTMTPTESSPFQPSPKPAAEVPLSLQSTQTIATLFQAVERIPTSLTSERQEISLSPSFNSKTNKIPTTGTGSLRDDQCSTDGQFLNDQIQKTTTTYCETPLDLSKVSSRVSVPSKQPVVTRNQERAQALLRTGCMPLFPPARRDWDHDEIVQLTVGPVCIHWPPRSWKTMSADRKLFSVEYAAMSLEAGKTPGHIPNIERGDLLDSYNFLVLPGSSLTLSSQPYRKCRYYNYETLRMIAVGQDIPDCAKFLDILEQSTKSRDQQLDSVLCVVDRAHIGLRLEP